MEYSLAEGLVLAVSEVLIDLYHTLRDRPRTFWGAWIVAFTVAGLLLLRPAGRSSREH